MHLNLTKALFWVVDLKYGICDECCIGYIFPLIEQDWRIGIYFINKEEMTL